ncbi:MAG: DUF2007 domain-containing protein [Muribaculaceae bacterium]|nr:DUF2007 domain-containing protein [Muribaculaceae bacterium]
MEPKLLVFFDNDINAQDIKSILNDSGIECILQNEMKTSVNVMSESAEEGVAVYVDKKDYPKAKEILDTYEEKLEEILKWCPECGSEDVKVSVVHVKYKPRWVFILCILISIACTVLSFIYSGAIILPGLLFYIAVIALILGYDKKAFHCNKCGCDF